MDLVNEKASKTKIIYKGDVVAGSFYLFVGVLSALGALLLYFFSSRLGLYYLTIGLSLLSIYLVGKGVVMMYLYYSRYKYYKDYISLNIDEIKEERRYTRWRVLKKKKNRRIYIYAIAFGCFIAFGGLFHQEKGLIVATCIPIVVMSAIEFTVGLLTEFRLTEYLKHLHKLTLAEV
ncbi:MAG: hypothetical protein ACJA1A_002931 [Saprospiraceae bacterium]